MNISKAIKQGWEECVGEKKKPKGKMLIGGVEADLKLHSDMALGYNTHRNHVKEQYPKALEAVIESLEEWVENHLEMPNGHADGCWIYRGAILKELNQAKETLQELNQK